ncbi:hypothetical protein IRJ41_002281 [Triplophysa rosa]|uniref:Uncharacterized protein n=1 Tax=Triplophysa rosa TaxID=992332 RepID=A0A9W7TFZ2_TRIRA|nr:hypothetical protein IRJ41_002281 [Triplophysa rosa]
MHQLCQLKTPVPLPKELMFLVQEPSASTQTKKSVSATATGKAPQKVYKCAAAILTYKKVICKSVMDELRRQICTQQNISTGMPGELLRLLLLRPLLPANPTKQHIREHCRTKIPAPQELLKRVEGLMQPFHLAADPNGVPLFKPSMLKTWRIQRVHILRGCLSDPEVAELFQAQGMIGVARWNFQGLVDQKPPDPPEQSRPSTARAGYLSADLDPQPESGSVTTLPAPLLSSCHGADVELQPEPDRYVKHLAKLQNTCSSLNASHEKLLQTQRLWHSLTEGSETTSVPVVTINPAVVNPPAPALTTPLTHETIERVVEGIMEKHQQPEQKKKQTNTCDL